MTKVLSAELALFNDQIHYEASAMVKSEFLKPSHATKNDCK